MLVFSRDNVLPSDVSNLLPGSRCILPNTKEYILNNSKVWVPIHALAIEFKIGLSTETLNSIQTQGIYAQSLNSNATLVKNYPTTSAGVLTVYVYDGQIFQQYQVLAGQTNENQIYSRGCYAGVWSPWITPNYLNITQTEWNTVSTNSHTHGNKVFLDIINQNLGTSHSPTFNGITANGAALNNVKFLSFLGGTWVDFPTTGVSGIGSGGSGTDAWVVRAAGAGQFFGDAIGGDIIYRNITGKLLFGNTSGQSAMQIANNLINITNTLTVGGNIVWHAGNLLNPLTQSSADTRYLRVSNPGVLENINNAGIKLTDTVNENVSYYGTGNSHANIKFNTLNLSGFGIYSKLINNTDSKFYIGKHEAGVDIPSVKLIEYDNISGKITLGIDKPIYFNLTYLGTAGTKVLTIDDTGRLSYIQGVPALDVNVVHKTGDENIQGIKTFQDKVVQNFTEIPYTNQKLFENVAEYASDGLGPSASISGNYKITLPIVSAPAIDTNNTMFFMRIYIYNYAGTNQGLTEGTISGYIYRNTYVGLQVDFPTNSGISQLRFGHNTNNNPVIFIDDSNTKQYPKIILKELQISFAGLIDLNWSNKSLWTNAISITADNTGFTLKSTILASSFKSNLQSITWGAGLIASPLGTYNGKVAQTITPVTGNGTTLGIVKEGTGTTVVAGAINVTYGNVVNTAAQGNDIRLHDSLTLGTNRNGLSLNVQSLQLDLATGSTAGAMSAADKTKLDTIVSGTNGTVTSVGITMPIGFTVSNSPVTSAGNLNVALTAGYYIPTTTDQSNWNSAVPYTGATQNLNLGTFTGTFNGITIGNSVAGYKGFDSNLPFSFLNGGGAQKIYAGGLLVSGAYQDDTKVPTNGIYSTGNIKTAGNLIAGQADQVQIIGGDNGGITYNAQENSALRFKTTAYNNPITFSQATNGEVLRIAANGFVGIGTTTPQSKLQVKGPNILDAVPVDLKRFNALKLDLGTSGFYGGQAQFWLGRYANVANHAKSSLILSLNDGLYDGLVNADTDVMTWLASGFVGIGTTAPTQKLDVRGFTRLQSLGYNQALTISDISNTDILVLGAGPTNGGQALISSASGSITLLPDISQQSKFTIFKPDGVHFGPAMSKVFGEGDQNYIDFSVPGNGKLAITTTTTQPITFSTTNVERLRITPTGNVGIGTETPTQKLDVNGSTRLNGNVGINSENDGYSALRVIGTSTAYGIDITSGTNGNVFRDPYGYIQMNSILFRSVATQPLEIATNNPQPILFSTGAIEKMRITSAGNVGIRTDSPMRNLHVGGASASFRVGPYYGVGEDRDYIDLLAEGSTSKIQTSNELFQIDNLDPNGSLVLQSTGGKVGIGTTAPTAKLHVVGSIVSTSQVSFQGLSYGRALNFSGDLNNLLEAGFYDGYALGNAPNGGWFHISVQQHSSAGGWLLQTITSFGASNIANLTYTRTSSGNGNWSPWKKLLGDSDITQNNADILQAAKLAIKNNSPFTGAQNGVNKNFVLPENFISNSTQVYVNGMRQMLGTNNDYIESGTNTIIFTDAPASTDNIIFDYVKA